MYPDISEFIHHLQTRNTVQLKAAKGYAISQAWAHPNHCTCNNCAIYRAVTGSVEEHGPFSLTDLNKIRALLGYPMGLPHKADQYK